MNRSLPNVILGGYETAGKVVEKKVVGALDDPYEYLARRCLDILLQLP